jgi:hypothetical protein
MSFSFDENEFGEVQERQDAADAALQSLEQPQDEQFEEDPELSDVDLRLATADYYRAILRHDFFDINEESPKAAGIVDREIRVFIRERLEVLLGLRDPRVPEVVSQFEPDEVQALKILASKVLKKPALVADEPVVRKMPAPAPSKPQTQVSRAKPQARKVPAPAPAPSTKPKTTPKPAATAEPKPATIAKSAPVAAKPTPKQDAEVQTFISAETRQQVTLVEGEVIEEKGRKYVVTRNELGTLYKRDITGQVIPPNRLPPMSAQQMSVVSAQMAEAQLGMTDESTQLAIVASLSK